jgi:hypothetical protein
MWRPIFLPQSTCSLMSSSAQGVFLRAAFNAAMACRETHAARRLKMASLATRRIRSWPRFMYNYALGFFTTSAAASGFSVKRRG